MANESIKNIALRIGVTTTGTDQVNALAKQLDVLAKEGGDAAPEFERLAAELRKLGQQDEAVRELEKIEAEIRTTTEAFGEARSEVSRLDAALQEQTSTVRTYGEQQSALKLAIASTGTQIREVGAELNLLRASTDTAGKGSDEYKNAVIALKTQLVELQTVQAQQKAQQKEINAAATDAGRALTQTSKAYDAVTAAVSTTTKELGAQNQQLATSKTELAELGLAAVSFADAEKQLAASMDVVRAETAAIVAEQDRAAASAIAMANAQRELSAQMEFEAETAQRLLTIEREQIAVSEKAAIAAREEAAARVQAANQTAEATQLALSGIGIKSAQSLRLELDKVRAAMVTIGESSTLSAGQIRTATAQAQNQIKSLEQQIRAANGELTIMDRISGVVSSGFAKLAGAAGGAYAFVTVGKAALDANVELQKLEKGLTAVYGSSKIAADQVEFLRNTTQSAGVSISDVSQSFVQFAASANASGIPLKQVDGLFASLTRASATLGLSGAKVTDMLNALGQMASKGTVQMEELRGQLGDALPGALSLTAKGLGLTTVELEQLVKSGGLLAQDIFPALESALNSLAGNQAVETMTQKWERFKNVLTESAQDIGKGAFAVALSDLAEGFGLIVTRIIFGFTLISESFTVVGKQIGTIMSAIVNRDFKDLSKALSDISKESDDRLGNLATRLQGVQAPANSAAVAVQQVGDATVTAGQQAATAAGGLHTNAEAQNTAATAATANTAAQTQVGVATAVAGQQAASAAPGFVAVANRYAQFTKVIEENIKIATQAAAARRAEGEVLLAVAKLTGDDVVALNAHAAASKNNADAATYLAANEGALLDVKKQQLAEEEKLAAQAGAISPQRAKQLADLRVEIGTLQEKVDHSKAAAAASQFEADSATLASAAYLDNSKRLDELKSAYESAANGAALLQHAADEGFASQEVATKASVDAAKAQYLYRDAINDSVAAAERQKTSAQIYTQLVGESTQTLALSAAAAQNYADKLALTTTLYQQQTAALRENIAGIKAEATAHGDADGKLAAEAEHLTGLLNLKEAEVTKSKQMTQASKDEAVARDIASKSYKDNSDRVFEYGTAARAANAELERTIQLQKEGKASADDVAAATRNAAQAEALYKDALHDSVVALQNKATVDTAYANQVNANINLDIARAKTQEALAKAQGNETAASVAQVQQKKLEADARQANANSMRQEANNAIALAEKERDEAQAMGTFTPSKKAEIEARITNANAKLTEAAAGDEAVKQINAEALALKNLAAQKASSAAGAGEAPVIGADGKPVPGFVQKTQIGQDTDAITNLRQRRDLGILGTGDKAAAEAALQAASANLEILSSIDAAFVSQQALTQEFGRVKDAKAILDKINSMAADTKAGATGNSIPGAVADQVAAQTPAASTSHTVNINIGGSSASIKTSSAADAAALSNILQQLQTASMRAS